MVGGMKIRQISLPWIRLILLLMLAASLAAAYQSADDRISAAEFSKIIKTFSEEGGYFLSDNLISNEDSYLTVLNKIREMHISGGAYIGVGPEQNFTYIAKLRPAIAFLIDIRREAMIQHLMYKSLFHLSKDRTEFLARLLSRPLKGKDAPGPNPSVGALMHYFSIAPADSENFDSNLAEIERTIQSDFQIPLTDRDKDFLSYAFKSFYREGIDISFQFKSIRRGGAYFMPSLRELIEQTDPDGKSGNFLASTDDYQFVRNLHEKNRIIPVTGDFAGPKTLKAIAGYLRDHSYSANVFYTSNVEMYLFEDDVFDAFVENVKALPVNPGSIFIRSVQGRGRMSIGNFRMTTQLQYISVFKKDHQAGLYPDYWTMVSTHHIPLDTK
jgi:hypothetical protein